MTEAGSALSRDMVEQTTRLVEFLRDLARAGREPVPDVNAHRLVLWLSDLPENAVVDTAAEAREVVATFAPVPAPAAGEEAADPRTAPARRWYDDLSTVHRHLSQQDDRFELVLATGLLTWQPPDAPAVRNHVLSTRLALDVDERTGVLRLSVAGDTGLRVHDRDLLTGLPGFDAARAEPALEAARAVEGGPLSDENHALLEQWRALALPQCRPYDKDWQPQEVEGTPALRFAPALVLRPRGRASLIGYYERMLAELSGPDAVAPLGLAQLLRPLEPEQRLDWLRAEGTGTTLAEDPLFPLPANPEQSTVMTRLRRDSGVVVQGPPGTGKTHTIANLISALVAEGQRVLVTSQKAQALAVLRDKVPVGVRQLCVSTADQGRGGSAELSRSVNALVERHAAFDRERYERQIASLTEERDAAKVKADNLTDIVRALREAETHEHPEVAPGYSGTLSAIATLLRERRDRLGWMPTPLPQDAPPALPVPPARIGELVGLLATATPERRARGGQFIPRGDAFLPPETFAELVAAEEAAVAAARAARTDLVVTLEGLGEEALGRLRAPVDRIRAGLATARGDAADWRRRFLADALAEHDALQWRQVADVAARAEHAETTLRSLGLHEVELPPFEAAGPGSAKGQLEAARALLEHFRAGGRLKGMLKPAVQRQAEPLLERATVDGLPPTTAELLAQVVARLEVEVTVAALVRRWAQAGLDVPADAPLTRKVSLLVGAHRDLTALDEVTGAVEAVRRELTTAGAAVPLTTEEEWTALVRALDGLTAQREARAATTALENAVLGLRIVANVDRAAPECRDLLTAVVSRDPAGYAAAVGALSTARVDAEQQTRTEELWQELNEAHPGLAQLVQATAADPVWQQRLGDLQDAWAWAAARTFFDAQRAPGLEVRLDARLGEAARDVRALTAKLAAARAWYACLTRMTAAQAQALRSYQQNIRSLETGASRYSHYYARGAREAMSEARGAVPAWIMPLADVLEIVPPDRNSFDVVIIDEASLASIESLFLLWLAPRLVVVGDERQCAPSGVSYGQLQPIFDKLDTYLPDVPRHLRNSLTPRDSLFSLLATRFGSVVKLREHFRCMPEIIEWSSRQFYADSPLIPLRQYGSDRLPPLRLTHVEGATTEGTGSRLRNPAEAAAIAGQVAACLADPAYTGRTFGVVVLQGDAQVELIEDELRRRIPPDVFEQRKLRVGTPPDFQGDERHVVMLSMVAAEKRYALSREEDQRRFNVAASRAQDQMWLFHSVAPDLLSPQDLRSSLLGYLAHPPAVRTAPELTDVLPDARHDAFDSLFEQRVYLRLRERGYQVTPRWEAGGRRIDLVVTGARGRLAVQCDGERWQASREDRLEDLRREQELRRAGWQFWRVRESEFAYDPEQALSGLWEVLERRGIRPHEGVEAGEDGEWVPVALSHEEEGEG
ncbi:very short patch repair endonuclease [Kineococcus sp. NUM-3379]